MSSKELYGMEEKDYDEILALLIKDSERIKSIKSINDKKISIRRIGLPRTIPIRNTKILSILRDIFKMDITKEKGRKGYGRYTLPSGEMVRVCVVALSYKANPLYKELTYIDISLEKLEN